MWVLECRQQVLRAVVSVCQDGFTFLRLECHPSRVDKSSGRYTPVGIWSRDRQGVNMQNILNYGKLSQ